MPKPDKLGSRYIIVPNTVTIRGETWVIIADSEQPHEDNLDGFALVDKREIHLAKGLPVEERDRVLVHELLHAVLPREPEVLSSAIEERACTAMARPLAEVLRQLTWRRSRKRV